MDFKPLNKKFADVVRWLEVRDDEGRNLKGEFQKLMKQFDGQIKKLAKLGPSPAVAKNEPNDLKKIKKLRTKGPRKLWKEFSPVVYTEKLAGAWLGRAAACTLGAAVEFHDVRVMKEMAKYSGQAYPPVDYWTIIRDPWESRYIKSKRRDYIRKNLDHIPCDDDLTYTLLGLLIMEDYGPNFTTADVGKAWLKYLPMACTAEHIALENLKAKVSWKLAGEKGNPFIEWIGADIRSDPWGYAAPGLPEKAAEMAYNDAFVSHRYGGIYGEMFFSAAIAAAFAVDHPLEACRIALTEIPAKSRAYHEFDWMIRQAPKIRDYEHAIATIKKRYPDMCGVHTIINAACTIFGLGIGGTDFTKVASQVVAMGWDNDCTAATAGSIVGAVVGISKISPHWYKPFGDRCRTYINGHEWFSNQDIIRRFASIALRVWQNV